MDDESIKGGAKAVEEMAKAAGKAIDAGRDAGGWLDKIFGTGIEHAVARRWSDRELTKRVEAAILDWERLELLMQKVEKRLSAKGIAQTRLPPPKVVLPLLEHATMEYEDELHTLWANLLATAMDPAEMQAHRKSLKAHEILNAAARAGRAGHLANGLVLLIPEPLISFNKKNSLSRETVGKLRSILPEDDHSVMVSDPLEVVLDRLMAGQNTDADVQYTVNRFAVLREVDGGTEEPTRLFDLDKSLSAYFAKRREAEAVFDAKVIQLKAAITKAMPGSLDNATAVLATQSGLSAQLLMDLRDRIRDEIGELPVTIDGWLAWTIAWLDKDTSSRDALLGDVLKSIIAAVGKTANDQLVEGDIAKLLPGIRAWITGQPIREIEIALGGTPDSKSARTKRLCPRARELVGTIIPRGLSFTLGLISKIAKGLDPFETQLALSQQVVEALSAAVRKGFDTPEKLFFASQHKSILSRVQMHEAFANRATIVFGQG